MKESRGVAEYVGDVARELAQLAAGASLVSLAQILRMAELEAHNIVVAMTPKEKKKTKNIAA